MASLFITGGDYQIYEAYSKKECDKVVAENFSMVLNDIYFISPPKRPQKISRFSVTVRMMYIIL
jgi:hypothetical protein